MTRYCPTCGAEYIDTATDCSDCSVPLQDTAPATVEEQEDHEILVYELNTWDEEQRGELTRVLATAGVPFQWEDTDLLVPAAQEAQVDELLDKVEFPDAIEAVVGDGDDDMDDEAVYQVMSDLFVISDRMADSKEVDLAVAGDFIEAAATAQQTAAPFGVDERLWKQIQHLANEISERLQNEEEDRVVIAEAATLRNALRGFV